MVVLVAKYFGFDIAQHKFAVAVALQVGMGVFQPTEATGVTETAERLYIQSLHAKGLGWRKP